MKPANHITNLKCFDQVAAVIGNANAQRELFKAAHCKDAEFVDKDKLCESFYWTFTTQGYEFWESIDEAINLCAENTQ